MKIYKIELKGPETSYDLRIDTKEDILSVGMQNDTIVVWYIHRGYCSAKEIKFHCINTGPEFVIGGDHKFLGTVTSSTGIVWHVFYEW